MGVHSRCRAWLNRSVTPAADPVPDDIPLLRAALVAEQLARREAEARASGAEAMVAYLKLLIAKLKHEQFGASSERGRKLLDQMELQLEELEASAAEDEAALDPDQAGQPAARGAARRKPVRAAACPSSSPPSALERPGCTASLSLRRRTEWPCSRLPPSASRAEPFCCGASSGRLPFARPAAFAPSPWFVA